MANIASVAGSSPTGSAASLQSPSPGISLDMPPGPRQSSVPSPTALLLDTTTSMGVVGGVFYGLIHVVPGFLVWLVTFTTITVPTVLFSLASTSLTVTLNATTLVFLILAFVSTVSWVVRYRYLTMYARLPPEPQRSENQIDLFPELPEGDSKRGLSNYLDEFLSAIKVFGYLERPVFHELTRTMQTKKLIAGETLMLEEEQGFCLVVDGSVQIFVKSKRNDGSPSPPHANGDGGEDDRDSRWGNQGYQLLTEVKNGAPMSSLFSILSLFTEDVKLRHDEHDEVGSRPPSRPSRSMHVPGTVTPMSSTMDGIQVDVSGSPRIPNARMRTTSNGNHLEGDGVLPRVPHMDLDHDNGEHQHYQTQEQQDHKQPGSAKHARRRRNESFHPDVVARATVDTTIAIIPATAFRRLTRTYPKASAHIVQVILSRLQRVTLTTGHAYLGLTSEVLRIEKLINRFTNYDLPDPLRGAALERLKEKFAKERERTTQEERTKGIALHKPRPQRSTRRDSGLGKHIAVQSMAARGRTGSGAGNMSENISFASPSADRSSVNAGDLLSLSQRNRSARHSSMSFSQPFHTALQEARGVVDHGSYSQSNARSGIASQVQDTADEDDFFRDSIVDCMLKAIGLTNEKNAIPGGSESVAQSPRLVSYDSRRHKAVFNNAFGFMDPLDMSADNDSESVLSIPASSTSVLGGTSIEDELSKDVEIVFFPQGSVLVEQGENNPGLYYVIDGFLDVSVPADDPKGLTPDGSAASPGAGDLFSVGPKGEPISSHGFGSLGPFGSKPTPEKGAKTSQPRQSLYLTKPGGLAGYLGTISSRRSFVDVTAKTDVYVGFLPRASIERIVEKYPIVLLTMAKRLTSLIPKLILHIDFALEWVQIDAGQTVYRQGQESDAIYIVLNGRLRALQQGSDSKVKVMGEYGQGDSVGELEVLTESKRPATLHAIRDTELAKLPKTLFNSLALENPEITIKISKIIATRMRDLMEDQSLEQKRDKLARAGTSSSSNINMRTVAVLPVTSGVPVVEFGGRLMQALTQIGHTNGVVSLNHAAILSHLGRHAFSRMGKLKLSQHLADLEEKYGLVLYVADTNVNSPWTQTCINQADCILLVALAEGSPNIGEYERLLITTKTTARKELVLLHSERYCPPGLTRRWLRNRMWINGSHHHIQMAFRNPIEPVHPQTRRFGNALKQRVQVIQAEIQKYTSRRVQHTPLYSADSPFKSDFHRLARRLTGKSVGLVLGGGGARGIAHIGIIRALEESGIPIDIVGGTSIGAFVGALYAWDGDVVPMYGRAKKFAGRMGSMWRFALDLTYPTASYTTGHEFNRGIYKTFGNAQIEDFWLEFYCNTTNISKSRPEIHTSGYVWRFVRASMSLAGLVPPMCDEGNMLLDGGYLDNLTVAHMKSLGADIIFAVDVGAVDDQSPQAFGDSLSGFWAVINRWNPFSNVPNAPTLSEIQGKLAYVSSIDTLEKAKSLPGCRYMRPPVVDYATLEFGKFEEIYLLGHKYGKEFIKSLREKGLLGIGEIEGEERKNMRRTMAPRRASI